MDTRRKGNLQNRHSLDFSFVRNYSSDLEEMTPSIPTYWLSLRQNWTTLFELPYMVRWIVQMSINFRTENYRWELKRIIHQVVTSIITAKVSVILSNMFSCNQLEINDQCCSYENVNLLITNRYWVSIKSFNYGQIRSPIAVSILVRNDQLVSAFVNSQQE